MKAHSHNVFSRVSTFTMLLGSITLSSVSGMQVKAQAKILSKTRAENVEAFLRSEMQQRRIPGLQVAIVQHGRIVLLRAYGVANLQYSVPVTNQTVFSINSITKAFTGVAMMQLVERGQVDLAAPVSAYLDGLPSAWRPVTIRQLLSHMSGIPNFTDDSTAGLRGGADEATAWKLTEGSPMDFLPGERFEYCQTNYALLLKILEKLRGKSYPQVIADREFRIAGMPNTSFGDAYDVTLNKAQSYHYSYTQGSAALHASFDRFTPLHQAASGINSTAEDMAHWLIALRDDRFIGAKARETMWTCSSFNNGKSGQWALGWIVMNRARSRAVGMTGGGRAAICVYPEEDLAVVVLTNLVGGYPEDFIDQVAKCFDPSLQVSGVSALRAALDKNGFQNAVGVADALIKGDTEINEDALNDWGYRLLSSGQPRHGLEVMKLATHIFPQSGNAFDSLADAYELNGDRLNSIQNYRRSLELDPKNTNAVERLKKLVSQDAKGGTH